MRPSLASWRSACGLVRRHLQNRTPTAYLADGAARVIERSPLSADCWKIVCREVMALDTLSVGLSNAYFNSLGLPMLIDGA
jgi:hypothetical protein